ncbi:hypothetical protein PSNIH1_14520 [Pantoea sp. PSNIH1]|nr:hypothetical protein PSNIH1_14520 [Pantoea sp. PSNIH1]
MAQGVPIRVYQVTVGTESATFANSPGQHNSSEIDAVVFDNIKMEARVSVDNSPTTTSSDDVEFRFYNLNKTTRQALMRENATLMLKAGYDTSWNRDSEGSIIAEHDTLPVIFIGGIVHAYTKKDPGSDDVLTIVNCSSDQKIRNMTKVSVSYKPNTPKADVIRDLVKRLGFPVSRMELQSLGSVAYPSGKAIYGQLDHALTRICKECGLQYSVHNGTISVIPANEKPVEGTDTSVDAWLYTPSQVMELDAYFEQKSVKLKPKKTGSSRGKKASAETPEDTDVSITDGIRTKTRQGINMRSHLNGNIKMHDFIKMDGLNAVVPDGADGDLKDGVYRVIRIDHAINWPQGDWSTALKLVEIQ